MDATAVGSRPHAALLFMSVLVVTVVGSVCIIGVCIRRIVQVRHELMVARQVHRATALGLPQLGLHDVDDAAGSAAVADNTTEPTYPRVRLRLNSTADSSDSEFTPVQFLAPDAPSNRADAFSRSL
ncbi:hypothetical protein V5799_015067 [Amblyomma americanum]|uniref:Uncharacterized protein n=1 Tax=Amblyomma americanum TaxID=6943 RepID=A0AAQ4E179_AMBAM